MPHDSKVRHQSNEDAFEEFECAAVAEIQASIIPAPIKISNKLGD